MLAKDEMREWLQDQYFVNEVGNMGTQLFIEIRNPTAAQAVGGICERGWAVTSFTHFEREDSEWALLTVAPIEEVYD